MLHANGYRISLDRKAEGSDIDFISHAHSDHIAAARSSKNILASTQTLALIGAVTGKPVLGTVDHANGAELLDSGHMLGSKQLCIDDTEKGKRIVYTGDFQMQHSRAAAQIRISQADTIIIDSTYPKPSIKFDDRQEVELSIQRWTEQRLERGIVLFTAYAMGKAQELITIMNESSVVPVVSKKIGAMSKVYNSNNMKLDYMALSQDADLEGIMRCNFVAITENRDLLGLKQKLQEATGKRVFTAIATGFAKEFAFATDVQFALSDHADFWQSKDYIDATGAKEVLTYGSSRELFAAHLKMHGYNARPFVAPSSGLLEQRLSNFY